ncbi:MAG TPA: SDR family NAD(P)-dependent oxidoreductase [Prolixibacteraceae bacterium]|nr:SDR family NAD(P)-dependent oxidoreductase [Prolixibacteraceae bacterium]
MNNVYTLITGASKGLGRELAREFARRGKNLLLVSLPGEALDQLCRELSEQYPIETQCLEVDFSQDSSVYDVAEWVNRRFAVETLVNNAGIGGFGLFHESDPAFVDRMIRINVRTPALLTRLLLPNLMERERGYILNVSSLAAFGPLAYKLVYPASKVFVSSFSRALCEELKPFRISVSALHPGSMRTNSEVVNRIDKLGFFARLGVLSPEKIARRAVAGMFRKKKVMVPGLYNQLYRILMKGIPLWIVLPVSSAVFKKEFNKDRAGASNKMTR